MSAEEFSRCWLEEYAPVAATLKGVRRYVVNVVRADSSDHEWDGFAELWFDDQESYDAAFAEPELADLMAEMRHRFIDKHRVFLVDEVVLSEDTE